MVRKKKVYVKVSLTKFAQDWVDKKRKKAKYYNLNKKYQKLLKERRK